MSDVWWDLRVPQHPRSIEEREREREMKKEIDANLLIDSGILGLIKLISLCIECYNNKELLHKLCKERTETTLS